MSLPFKPRVWESNENSGKGEMCHPLEIINWRNNVRPDVADSYFEHYKNSDHMQK